MLRSLAAFLLSLVLWAGCAVVWSRVFGFGGMFAGFAFAILGGYVAAAVAGRRNLGVPVLVGLFLAMSGLMRPYHTRAFLQAVLFGAGFVVGGWVNLRKANTVE
jgi:fructose-specific phosphotransferase system IIC component